MSRKRFTPGKFVRIQLADGSYAYGRLRKHGFASFYNFQTIDPIDDLDSIAEKPILFTVMVYSSVLKKWEVIGTRRLEDELLKPVLQYRQPVGSLKCVIFDDDGYEKVATPEECEGLERSSVWAANHVEDRLLDSFLGRPNVWVEQSKVRYE